MRVDSDVIRWAIGLDNERALIAMLTEKVPTLRLDAMDNCSWEYTYPAKFYYLLVKRLIPRIPYEVAAIAIDGVEAVDGRAGFFGSYITEDGKTGEFRAGKLRRSSPRTSENA